MANNVVVGLPIGVPRIFRRPIYISRMQVIASYNGAASNLPGSLYTDFILLVRLNPTSNGFVSSFQKLSEDMNGITVYNEFVINDFRQVDVQGYFYGVFALSGASLNLSKTSVNNMNLRVWVDMEKTYGMKGGLMRPGKWL